MDEIVLNIDESKNIVIEEITPQKFNAFWDIFSSTINSQFAGDFSLKLRDYFLRVLYSKKHFKDWIKKKEII